MTEEEARKKWCPFSRVTWDAGETGKSEWTTYNRLMLHGSEPLDFPQDDETMCIGSHCMAWRFTDGDSGCCGLVRS